MRKVLLPLALLALVAAAYFRFGWNQMVETCTVDVDAMARRGDLGASVEYSWEPVHGFTCTFMDDSKRQSFWFFDA